MSDEIKKAVDELVEQTLSRLNTEEVTKAPEPVVEEVVSKSEVKVEESEEKKEEAAEEKGEEKEEKKPAKQTVVKKSLEELQSVLSEDELQVIAAWREELASEELATEEEPVQKSLSSEDLSKVLASAINPQLEEIKKALEQKDDLIKSLTERLEKLAAEPAYAKRSIENLSVIEKSQESSTLNKSRVLDIMLELQKSGSGVTAHHIAEFEATNNISNQHIRQTVLNACKS